MLGTNSLYYSDRPNTTLSKAIILHKQSITSSSSPVNENEN